MPGSGDATGADPPVIEWGQVGPLAEVVNKGRRYRKPFSVCLFLTAALNVCASLAMGKLHCSSTRYVWKP